MQPKIICKPAFIVVGLKWHGKMNEVDKIPNIWARFPPRGSELCQRVNPSVYYGVMGNGDGQTTEFEYLAGQQVTTCDKLPPGMSSWHLPAQTYAVFSTNLPNLTETLDEIAEEWLPTSGYQRGSGPEFELYEEHFDPSDPKSEMFVYVPIVKG